MKFNWNQAGMPVTLVNRLGPRNEFAEFKTVLSDAGNHVMRSVDAELMARELVESGGRELVEMVRELTTALSHAETELENANRRYERLVADLVRRGISLKEDIPPNPEEPVGDCGKKPSTLGSELSADEEWEDWNRKFQSLLG